MLSKLRVWWKTHDGADGTTLIYLQDGGIERQHDTNKWRRRHDLSPCRVFHRNHSTEEAQRAIARRVLKA